MKNVLSRKRLIYKSLHFIIPVENEASKLSVAGLASVGGCTNLRQIVVVVILDLVILGKRKYCYRITEDVRVFMPSAKKYHLTDT